MQDEASLNKDNVYKHLQEWRKDCTPCPEEIECVVCRGICPPRGKSFIRRGKYDISLNLVHLVDNCYWCGYLDCRGTMTMYCGMCEAVVCNEWHDTDCGYELGLYDRVSCVGCADVDNMYCPRLGRINLLDAWQTTGKITTCSYPQCVPCALLLLDLRRYSTNGEDNISFVGDLTECRTGGRSFCRRCAANYLCYNDCTWDAELEILTCANKGCQSVELKIRDIINERVKAFEWRPHKHSKMQRPYRSAMRVLAILAKAV